MTHLMKSTVAAIMLTALASGAAPAQDLAAERPDLFMLVPSYSLKEGDYIFSITAFGRAPHWPLLPRRMGCTMHTDAIEALHLQFLRGYDAANAFKLALLRDEAHLYEPVDPARVCDWFENGKVREAWPAAPGSMNPSWYCMEAEGGFHVLPDPDRAEKLKREPCVWVPGKQTGEFSAILFSL
jgi:hypothetical protein